MARLRQAARARELDVVGAQHLQHLGAHQPHDQRELEDRQRDRRQHDVVPAVAREQAGGPPAQPAPSRRGRSSGTSRAARRTPGSAGCRSGRCGSDTPSSDIVMNTWLHEGAAAQRRVDAHRNADARRPARAATRASSSVAGKRSPIRRETLAPWRRLRPNSPCAAFTRKCQNCTKKGWSSPRSARSCADLVGLGVLPEQEDHRVADVLEQQERDERDRDHHDHGLDQSAQDEGEHSMGAKGQSMLAEQAPCRPQGFLHGLQQRAALAGAGRDQRRRATPGRTRRARWSACCRCRS